MASKADLLLHPTRNKILHVLRRTPRTTQQIVEQLPEVPASSIYRHLKLLLDGGMLVVARTNRVRGVDEKVYQLAQSGDISLEEMRGFTEEDWARHFRAAMGIVTEEMLSYLNQADDNEAIINNILFYQQRIHATEAEWQEIKQAIGAVLAPYQVSAETNTAQPRSISLIAHPNP